MTSLEEKELDKCQILANLNLFLHLALSPTFLQIFLCMYDSLENKGVIRFEIQISFQDQSWKD